MPAEPTRRVRNSSSDEKTSGAISVIYAAEMRGSISSLGTSDPDGSVGSTITVAFSTFVFTESSYYFICGDPNASNYERNERLENNIFYAAPSTGSSISVFPRACAFANNIMFPQSNPIAGNAVVDPKLVDVAGKNYRLMMDSPAVNTGQPSTGLTTGHDFDGVARPQGAAHDIGAFERQ